MVPRHQSLQARHSQSVGAELLFLLLLRFLLHLQHLLVALVHIHALGRGTACRMGGLNPRRRSHRSSTKYGLLQAREEAVRTTVRVPNRYDTDRQT